VHALPSAQRLLLVQMYPSAMRQEVEAESQERPEQQLVEVQSDVP
jgi:hypothetical protein